MEKSIFFLKREESVGKAIGKVSMRAQVDTNGNWAASLNRTEGETSPKPNGGTESHPVKKTMTSLRLGDRRSLFTIL